VDLTTVYDCTGANLAKITVPPGVLMAGYITGTDGVAWTAAQWAAHPRAIVIDQSPEVSAAEPAADVFDVERGAVTLQELGLLVSAAQLSYRHGTRPGQREPTIYASRSNVTPVVNTLNNAHITSGVNLWVAEEMPPHAAIEELNAAGGPFPIVGIQYGFGTDYDISLFSNTWLDTVSARPPASHPAPGTQAGWRHCRKCKTLFFGPEESVSVCPVGAQHDGSQSHDYTLGFVK